MYTMSVKRDLVVIGGGAGGLVVASVAAQLGLDVVLINREEAMGGDCLHTGCVPSKALLKSASVAHTLSNADRWGLDQVDQNIDISKINRVIKQVIDTIQVHDSRERFESLGCEVISGTASFKTPCRLNIKSADSEGGQPDRQLEAKRIVIATGSSVFIPDIKGLELVDYLTSDDMFTLPVLPESMIILGGGPVGIEMAQACSRLGTKVTIIERAPRLIPALDKVLSKQLTDVLVAEGISVYVDKEVVEVSEADEKKQVVLSDGSRLQTDALLIAIGRRAAVESLNLESAGVKYDNGGIMVDNRMRTSNKRIYACGDVTGKMPLTHVAELQAGIIIANMLFRLPKKINYDVIPLVIYTEPEVASVGVSSEHCMTLKNGEAHQFDVSALDRALCDNQTTGVARILTDKGRIIGAQIIAPHAGELIHELALAIQARMKVSDITSLVHAYPSYAQLNKRLAGQYYQQRLFSPRIKKLVAILNRFLP